MVELNKVVPLENIITFFEHKESNNEEKQHNDWVDAQKEIGDIGEVMVKQFLEKEYGAKVEKQLDSKGFDFLVKFPSKTVAVEVKTTTNSLRRFFISYNELKTAYKLKDKYNIYYVCMDGYRKSLYIINNPIHTLQISDELINHKVIDNDMICAEIEGLIVGVKNLEAFLAVGNLNY